MSKELPIIGYFVVDLDSPYSLEGYRFVKTLEEIMEIVLNINPHSKDHDLIGDKVSDIALQVLVLHEDFNLSKKDFVVVSGEMHLEEIQ